MKYLIATFTAVLMLTAVSWGQDPNTQQSAQSDYTTAIQTTHQQTQANIQGRTQTINRPYQRAVWSYNNQSPASQQAALEYYQLSRRERPSKYWVGVQCVPADEVEILSDIPLVGSLFRRGGLRVNSITENSPAAASDLKNNDVIVLFNEKQVNAVDDLIAAIAEAGTKPCTLKVVRDSQFVNCTLTPAERPKTKEKMEPWAQLTWNPGQDYTYWHSNGKLPEDVQMTIIQEGGGEPFMVFRRDEDQWTIREGNVAELPDDIQLFAASVHNALLSLRQPNSISYQGFQPTTRLPFLYRPPAEGNNQREAIDRLSNTVSELQAAIEELSKRID